MRQEADHLEPRVRHLEGIITGDGKEMGIGPLVLKHEEDIHGDNGLTNRVRKIEDQSLRTAAWVGGAVAAAVAIVEVLFRIWDTIPK